MIDRDNDKVAVSYYDKDSDFIKIKVFASLDRDSHLLLEYKVFCKKLKEEGNLEFTNHSLLGVNLILGIIDIKSLESYVPSSDPTSIRGVYIKTE